jgi:hypothetical protein
VPEAPVPEPPAPVELVDVDEVVVPVDVARPVDVSTVLLPPAAASGVADPVGDSVSLQAKAAAIDSADATIRQLSSPRKKPPRFRSTLSPDSWSSMSA